MTNATTTATTSHCTRTRNHHHQHISGASRIPTLLANSSLAWALGTR
jgi:hypothetical protein